MLGSLLVGVLAQIYRYRRVSTPTQRQQTKWIMFGLIAVFIATLAWTLLFELFPLQSGSTRLSLKLGFGIAVLLYTIFPVSLVFSILRYRLWDIDILINRTLVYGLLTGVLALLYFGSVVLLQSLFGALSEQGSQLAIVASTLAIAALFNPLRRRIQDGIDRRLYRRKYNAEKTLAAFAATARDEVDLEKLSEALLAVVEEDDAVNARVVVAGGAGAAYGGKVTVNADSMNPCQHSRAIRPSIAYDIEGAGPPLVTINGITDHRNSIPSLKLRQTFAERYTVLSLDNRGAGQTLTESGASVTIEVMADDIVALMDQHDLVPAHVHGVSMGGLIAKTLALRHPDKVSTLVSCVSSAGFESPRAHFLLHTWRDMADRQLPRDLINRFTATFLLSEEVFAYDRFMKAWVNADVDPFEQTREGFDQQMDAIKEYDIREKLGDISMPTLVAGSPGDMLVPLPLPGRSLPPAFPRLS